VTVAQLSYHSPYLPWSISQEEKRRFRKIVVWVFSLCLLLALVVPFLPVPEIDREKAETLPPRLAKLVLERKKAKPPPPVEAPVLAPKQQEIKKPPKPKKQMKPEKKVQDVQTARKKAERAGLLAFKDELAALRDNPVVAGLNKDKRLQRGSGEKAPKPERSVIVANAAKASGGINTSDLSRDTGGSSLSGRTSIKVSSPISRTQQARASRSRRNRRKASRTIEEIQLVFDKNKSAIYTIYNRALRKDPTLEGKVVLKITIKPSGKVTACEIVSSELGDPKLERKIVARVMLFDFGNRDVETMVVTYPIDFLPS
jgi:TonB family protein